ncbi:MAG: HAMP domain-containing protein, partial [Synechocystis sp.]
MQSSLSKPGFPAEILELEKLAHAEPDNLIHKITLAGALQAAGYFPEAADYYRQAQALDQEQIYAETIGKALMEIAPYLNAEAGEGETGNADSPRSSQTTVYPPEIAALQQSALEDSSDLVAQITFANALEEGGYLTDAIAVYRQLKIQDKDGLFHGTCDQAIAGIEEKLAQSSLLRGESPQETPAKTDNTIIVPETVAPPSNFLQSVWKQWADLPIATKQFTALLTASALSIAGVVGTGMVIALLSGRAQLKNQTLAELVVSDSNYNVKINEMISGFRGQAENASLIDVARLYAKNEPIPPQLLARAKAILKNETNARNIEYATLLGFDQKIIASANADRQGEIFNPDDLVRLRIGYPANLDVAATAIVSKSELDKEQAPNRENVSGSDALIRYVVTPVTDPQTRQKLGNLVTGDLVNGKDEIVKRTLEAFGGGYSAVYYLTPDGNTFELASSLLQTNPGAGNPNFVQDVPLPDESILQVAKESPSGVITTRTTIDGQPMTLAVKILKNLQGRDSIAFLVRGTPEAGLNALLRDTFLLQLAVGALMLLVAGVLAYQFGRTLTQPLKKLKETAQKIGEGKSGIRAEVESQDEVGQLAATFNDMAAKIEDYTDTIQETSRQRMVEAETQREQKEKLQAGVVRLLTNIEESAKGDLTVRSAVEEGAVGSIADAFNATLAELRQLVKQVVDTASEVSHRAQRDSQEIIGLSDNALSQTRALESATTSVAELAQSIESVANSAQTAA